MESARGKGVKGGMAPQEAGKISSQCSVRARTTWARTRRTRGEGPDKSDVMKKDLREQSELFSEQDRRNYVVIITEMILK
jgi:hypothetical protein